MSQQKIPLRRRLLALRRAIRGVDRQLRQRRATHAICRLREFKAGARIAVYRATGSELCTAGLIRQAQARGVRLYLPAIRHFQRGQMRFTCVHRGAWLAPRWFNLIVVPLVGIDAQGIRLGMGAGFYDRALRFRRLRRHWRGPRLVGLAFDSQRVDTIHPDPWDIALDSLATESGLHLFKRRA